jgi:hypothetical protein
MKGSLVVDTELAAVAGDTLLDIAMAQKSHTQQEPLAARSSKGASVVPGKAAADVHSMDCALPGTGAGR